MPNFKFERAKRQYNRDTEKTFTAGILGGYTKAGVPIIDEPLLPGYGYVRIVQSNGKLSQSFALPFEAGIPKVFGQPVRLGYNKYNQFCVLGADTLGQGSQGTNTLGNNASDPNVSYYIVQQRLTTANSHPVSSSAPSMLVTIQNWLWIEARTVNYFLGGDGDGITPIDLTSYIPASAGMQCAACLFIKTDNTIEVITSTPQSLAISLDISDIQECVTASSVDSKPIWSWRLYNGQTGITPGNIHAGGDDFFDLRQLINVSDGSGGGTVTDVTATSPLSSSGGATPDISHDASGVTAGSYTSANITVDAEGHVTAAANGSGGGSSFPISVVMWQEQSSLLVGSGSLTIQYATAPYGFVLYQASHADGDSWETQPFFIAAGTYTFYVLGSTDTNRGKIDWYLDADISPFITGQDWNAGSNNFNVLMTGSITIPTDGNHTITGIINGTSGGAGDYYHALVKMWIQ